MTPEEQQIAQYGKQNGKTPQQVAVAIAKYRMSSTRPTGGYSLKEAGGDVLETIKGVGSQLYEAGEDILTRDIRKPNENIAERIVGYGANVFGGIAGAAGELVTGAGKLALSQDAENTVADTVSTAAKAIADNDYAQKVMQQYQSLSPATRDQVDNVLEYLDGVTTIVAPGVAQKIAGTIVENAAKRTKTALNSAASTAKRFTAAVTPDQTTVAGVKQTASELAQRVPRAFNRGQEAIQDAAERSARIKASSPAVGNAVKVGVSEPIINTLTAADTPTLKAYRSMVEIADAPKDKLRPTARPADVAGQAAEQTFDVLEQERKRIGAALESEIAKLPKNTTANMGPSKRQITATLAENGITVTREGTLSYAGKYTKAERARIEELWGVVNELPETISAKQLREMDQLLSKLQREARMEGVQNIMLDVNGGTKNLFQLFRESYTNQLENLNPNIRRLNREYRDARILIDDLEDTIFKSGNFESIKGVDQSEFAKVNLRRIMGEAQSSTAYAEILNKMDARARQLGYTGPRADDLIYFAEELRKLYPETIPKTGFQGGIRTGVRDIAERLVNAGAPNVVDQRKAIQAMLDELLSQKP